MRIYIYIHTGDVYMLTAVNGIYNGIYIYMCVCVNHQALVAVFNVLTMFKQQYGVFGYGLTNKPTLLELGKMVSLPW